MSRQAPRLASRATQRDLWSLFELLKRLGIDGAEAAFLRCTRRRFGLTPGFRPSSGEIPRGPFLPTPSWRCGRGSREREREGEREGGEAPAAIGGLEAPRKWRESEKVILKVTFPDLRVSMGLRSASA